MPASGGRKSPVSLDIRGARLRLAGFEMRSKQIAIRWEAGPWKNTACIAAGPRTRVGSSGHWAASSSSRAAVYRAEHRCPRFR
jgi:hypothetical protein